jgi:hypothetical protein
MYGGDYWATQLGAWLVGTLIQVLFLLTLRGVLKAVAPENRAMRPDLVWLNLVPYVQYVWMFVTLVKIRDSLRAESKTRGRSLGGDAAFRVGLASAVLFVLTFLLSWVVLLVSDLGESLVVLITGLGLLSLLFWALYWTRSSRLRASLEREVPATPVQPAASVTSPESNERRCPTCGLLALADDDYCRSCGLDLRAPQSASASGGEGTEGQCPFCGAAYRPHARFCSKCGREVV